MDKNVNTPIGLYRAEARQILKRKLVKSCGSCCGFIFIYRYNSYGIGMVC